jgi:hypothetical protein
MEGLQRLGTEKMLKAAFIMHANYGKFDLCAHILDRHDRAFGGSRSRSYLAQMAAMSSR